MEKKIYAHNIKVGMELKTVWGYAPVVEVEVIDGTMEFMGKTYPTRKTIVTVESDKINKYTYKLTETVYVNVPEVKAEPTVVNVATADELVKPERVELVVDAPVYETGEVVKVGDQVKCIDKYADYEGCRGTVIRWFMATDGRLLLDTTVDGGTWLEIDEVAFIDRAFKLDNLSVGDMVKPNKTYYITYNDTATVLKTYINSRGGAVADVLYTDGHTDTLDHADIEVLCKASEVDIYPETTVEDVAEPTTPRGYTRGFKRTDLKAMAIFRKYFIPVTKPNKKIVATDNKPVEISQTSGEMVINLNGRTVPKPVIKEIEALVNGVGVKVKYIK